MHALIERIRGVSRAVYFILFILHAALIWYFSSRTWEGTERHLPGGFGNLMHLVLFGGLGFFALGALPRDAAPTRRVVFAVLFAAIWGLIDEIHQFHVPGRTCSLFDLMDDAAGALFVTLAAEGLIFQRFGRRTYLLGAILALFLGIFGALDFGNRWPTVDQGISRGIEVLRAR